MYNKLYSFACGFSNFSAALFINYTNLVTLGIIHVDLFSWHNFWIFLLPKSVNKIVGIVFLSIFLTIIGNFGVFTSMFTVAYVFVWESLIINLASGLEPVAPTGGHIMLQSILFFRNKSLRFRFLIVLEKTCLYHKSFFQQIIDF